MQSYTDYLPTDNDGSQRSDTPISGRERIIGVAPSDEQCESKSIGIRDESDEHRKSSNRITDLKQMDICLEEWEGRLERLQIDY